MNGAAKIADRVVLDGGAAQQTTRTESPKQRSTSGTSVWGNADEQVSSNSFWPETKRRHTSQEGVCFRPSEVHRLKSSFGGESADASHSELDDLDDKIATTFAEFRAAPRDSVQRTELGNQLDALKAAKEALQDELDDVANWSA